MTRIYLLKCRNCESFYVERCEDDIVVCLECGCVYIIGGETIYEGEEEEKIVPIPDKPNPKMLHYQTEEEDK